MTPENIKDKADKELAAMRQRAKDELAAIRKKAKDEFSAGNNRVNSAAVRAISPSLFTKDARTDDRLIDPKSETAGFAISPDR